MTKCYSFGNSTTSPGSRRTCGSACCETARRSTASTQSGYNSRVQPAPFDINIFILTVYARRNGRWQQIAWQSTRDVATSPAK
jgi:hypothetical protein